MKLVSFLFCLVGTGLSAFAQLPVLSKNMQYPESVITDGKFIYVANIGKTLEPSAKDGNGSIRKLSLTGKLLTANFAKTILHAPKGMAIVKNVLYTADVDRIVGISLGDGKLVREISFASFKTQLVNDIVSVDDTTLYATATDIHQVFKVNIGTDISVTPLEISPVIGANGICYDRGSKRLYIVGLGLFTDQRPTGKIGYIDLSKPAAEYVPIPVKPGFYDGVAVTDDRHLIVSDWGSLQSPIGALYEIDIKTGRSTRLKLPGAIAGPADIWLDHARKRLLIPETLKGKLLTYQIK
ncbi:hypothetical protein [Mucilaginibacter sp. HD30]